MDWDDIDALTVNEATDFDLCAWRITVNLDSGSCVPLK
mgnify:CR=1 FL=1